MNRSGNQQVPNRSTSANGAGDETAALGLFGRHWGSTAMFERARMANDYASERRAAGRSVPADIGLLAFDPEELRATRIPD